MWVIVDHPVNRCTLSPVDSLNCNGGYAMIIVALLQLALLAVVVRNCLRSDGLFT